MTIFGHVFAWRRPTVSDAARAMNAQRFANEHERIRRMTVQLREECGLPPDPRLQANR